MIVTDVSQKQASKNLVGTLYVGKMQTKLQNCKVVFVDEVMKILNPKLICKRTKEENVSTTSDIDNKRMYHLSGLC